MGINHLQQDKQETLGKLQAEQPQESFAFPAVKRGKAW